MLGVRSAQYGLLEADHLYRDFVGRDTFYGFLAEMRGQLFKDEEFAKLYCRDNGRDSVPPSMLATALLLQTHDKVSDEEAKERADFDIRWKVALGIGIEEKPFAKSTLQLFRAHLILHEEVRAVFQRSLCFAKETGYLKGHRMKAAIDTTFILGRGAVKDTYNLLADGIMLLVRALAEMDGVEAQVWAEQHELGRYFGSSIKGDSAVDWDNEKARNAFLQGIVADADRLLELARQAQAGEPEESDRRKHIVAAANLLGQLLLQDVERKEDGAVLKQGVSRDRVVSVHDPEIRHGHKSSSNRFEGHKAAVLVDTDSQLITAADTLPGNAHDHTGAVEMVKQSEENTGIEVEATIGDAAYGDGATRQAFVEAERTLVAKVPGRPNKAFFPKEDFKIDLEAGTCTCPTGQVTHAVGRTLKSRADGQGRWQRFRGFIFDAVVCAACELRYRCIASKKGKGRTVTLHPQEALLQQARALEHSEAFGEYKKRRQVSEHRIARLVQLGIRQARYRGRAKTLFQLLLSATVANMTLVAGELGLMKKQVHRLISAFVAHCHRVASTVRTAITRFRSLCSVFRSPTRAPTVWLTCIGGFRPDF
ncbi:MAG: IS1182 family transposase [Chloroflexi bacterium]|nr:IS1182 family transposase [Chloroflexota bacterium]